MKRLYLIKLDYAVFAIETENDIIINTPPITRWTIDKSIKEFKDWVLKKRGMINEIS